MLFRSAAILTKYHRVAILSSWRGIMKRRAMRKSSFLPYGTSWCGNINEISSCGKLSSWRGIMKRWAMRKSSFLPNGTSWCGNINEISWRGNFILAARHIEAPGNAKITFFATLRVWQMRNNTVSCNCNGPSVDSHSASMANEQ